MSAGRCQPQQAAAPLTAELPTSELVEGELVAADHCGASTVGILWAQSVDGVIGRDGTLPWTLPEDLLHFRAVTAGSTVIMGRRTWESLPPAVRPLPGRTNVVLTRDPDWSAPGAVVRHTLSSALTRCGGPVWIIGGAQVYAAALPYADQLLITEIDVHVTGDVFAPPVPAGVGGEWSQAADPTGWQDSRQGLRYRYHRWTRT
jgi:dihydrofolate reductase